MLGCSFDFELTNSENMSYKSIYISAFAVLLVILLFGFNRSGSMELECGKTPPKKDELKFYLRGHQGLFINMDALQSANNKVARDDRPSWNAVYSRSINKRVLLAANKIDDVIQNYPASWITYYDAVWVKARLGEEYVSLMTESNELSLEQKSLFKRSDIGTNFEIVINYHITDTLTKELIYERLNVELTLVPEKEARFPKGYDQLIAYFEDNSLAYFSEKKMDDFTMVRINFTIGEDGAVEEVHQSHASGYEAIDQYILDLVKTMPAWVPAQDEDGKLVKQVFELIYGTSGC